MLMSYIMTGFPPPDRRLRKWLLSGKGKRLEERRRLHGFVYALLTITRRELERLESDLFGETYHHCQSNIH